MGVARMNGCEAIARALRSGGNAVPDSPRNWGCGTILPSRCWKWANACIQRVDLEQAEVILCEIDAEWDLACAKEALKELGASERQEPTTS